MVSLVRRAWIPLVITLIVGVGTLTVTRLRPIFGSDMPGPVGSGRIEDTKPFNPKRVLYEVFGPPGGVADINYVDDKSETQQLNGVTLPWSILITTTAPSAMTSLVAQGPQASLGCRITVNDQIKVEKSEAEPFAFTYCFAKNA